MAILDFFDNLKLVISSKLLRIDITSMIQNKNDRKIDAGHLLCYTPLSIGHLVVVTSTSKMLKLEAKSGQLISEVSDLF